ncbi:hypothetical protein C8R43DRAFT_50034 [Mycena crocata]|nr:hypothetical protein C8R43DRAFT_50034 [Mycena crocata]
MRILLPTLIAILTRSSARAVSHPGSRCDTQFLSPRCLCTVYLWTEEYTNYDIVILNDCFQKIMPIRKPQKKMSPPQRGPTWTITMTIVA